MVENKKYINAVKFYKAILAQAKGSRLGGQFIGEIHHNMGCAYMHMFQYEEALDCFMHAYECLPEAHILKAYLTACYITKPYAQFLQLVNQLNVSDTIRNSIEKSVKEVRESVPEQTDITGVDAYLEKVRKEYHNSTDH